MDSVGIPAGEGLAYSCFLIRSLLRSVFRSSRISSTNLTQDLLQPISCSPSQCTKTRINDSSSCQVANSGSPSLDGARVRTNTGQGSNASLLCADQPFFSSRPKLPPALAHAAIPGLHLHSEYSPVPLCKVALSPPRWASVHCTRFPFPFQVGGGLPAESLPRESVPELRSRSATPKSRDATALS